MTALGSCLDERIAQAKRNHNLAKRRKHPETIAKAQVNLYDAMKPKTEHFEAVKTVKSIENAIKLANQRHDRAEKLQTIFNEMRR